MADVSTTRSGRVLSHDGVALPVSVSTKESRAICLCSPLAHAVDGCQLRGLDCLPASTLPNEVNEYQSYRFVLL